MEIYIDIWVEDENPGNKTKPMRQFITFLACRRYRRPVEVPQIMH
jgi:acyl-CoA hydrolase